MGITLGSVSLRDFEIPEAVHYQGVQRLATHRLGTGRRIVDALGPEESDIVFGGVISGPDALARARAFDGMRSAGRIVPLRWDALQFDVIVRSFAASYASAQWIPYRLSCVLIDAEADAGAGDRIGGDGLDREDLQVITSLRPELAERLLAMVDADGAGAGRFRLSAGQGRAADDLIRELAREVQDLEDRLHDPTGRGAAASVMIPSHDVARQLADAVLLLMYARRLRQDMPSE